MTGRRRKRDPKKWRAAFLRMTFRRNTLRTFDDLMEHLSVMERSVVQAREDAEKWLKDMESKISSDEEAEQHGERIFEHEHYFQHVHPSNVRYSFIFLLTTVMETQLNRYCRMVQEEKGKKLSLCDLSDRGITRARKYLDKVLEMYPANSANWTDIDTLIKVRNAITHANGEVAEFKEKKFLKDLARQGIGVNIDKGRLELERNFCWDMLKAGEELFRDLFSKKKRKSLNR